MSIVFGNTILRNVHYITTTINDINKIIIMNYQYNYLFSFFSENEI